jgi:hypothetical protein
MASRQSGGPGVSAFSPLCHRHRHCEIRDSHSGASERFGRYPIRRSVAEWFPTLGRNNTNNSSCNVRALKIKEPCCKSCSFRGDRIQWKFLGQTAASGCKGFPTFRDVTPSQNAVLVLSNHQHILKMQSWCYQTSNTP